MVRRLVVYASLVVLALVLVSCGPPGGGGDQGGTGGGTGGGGQQFITIGTGGQSGVYYPTGSALASVWQSNLDVTTSVESTGASAENINLLDQGRIQVALIQADAASQAYSGTGAFDKKIRSFQAMAALYPQYVQIITTGGTGIETIQDLQGKNVAVGSPNSGVELNASTVLDAYGITYDDLSAQYLSYSEAIDGMKNGTTDAGFFTSGLPNPAVTDLSTSAEVRVVPVDGEGAQKLLDAYSYFNESSIPADTYGNSEDVPTLDFNNLLVVSKDLSEDMVYELTKTMWDNIGQVQNAHNAAEEITRDTAQQSVPIPFAPGAKRYYDQ
ncbi:MAG: TAXI family TRAP transporter solute-binding subunit [Rubrobacteraceae bacterium]